MEAILDVTVREDRCSTSEETGILILSLGGRILYRNRSAMNFHRQLMEAQELPEAMSSAVSSRIRDFCLEIARLPQASAGRTTAMLVRRLDSTNTEQANLLLRGWGLCSPNSAEPSRFVILMTQKEKSSDAMSL